MKTRVPATLLCLTVLVSWVSGCASPRKMDYTDFRLHRPRSILVLPPLNKTTAVQGTYGYLSTVTLPLASEPGNYEFEVLRDPDRPLAFGKGEARSQNGLTVASVKLDLSEISPGAYFWGIRRKSQAWAYCPIRIIP